MKTSIEVPAGFAVAILTQHPTVAMRVVDGIGVYLHQFDKRAHIKPLDHDWELSLDADEAPLWRLIDQRGYENIDTRPVEIPADLRVTPSLRDQVVEQISRYLAARAVDEGYETLEEAHDFDMQGEVDDLATEAENAFLAAFKPHEGRAANDASRGVPALPQVAPADFKPPVAGTTMTEEQPPS